jgi:hypothetical protein
VTAATRVAALARRAGYWRNRAGYEADVYYGISVPRGTPPEIVAKLNEGSTRC